MPKARLALITAAVLMLVGAPFAFRSTRPSTLHFMRAQTTQDGVLVRFALNNPPSHYLGLSPVRLEVRSGSGWQTWPYGVAGYTQSAEAAPDTAPMLNFLITRFAGRRLRLVAQAQRELNGLDSFAARLKLWVFGKNRSVSLNPFNKNRDVILTDRVEIVSDEFTEP